jgi:hypothetical protein
MIYNKKSFGAVRRSSKGSQPLYIRQAEQNKRAHKRCPRHKMSKKNQKETGGA